MVSILISRFVILTCGTLYPAYRSYKTVKTKNVREYVKWMMYWIVFAIFLCTEALADTFVSFWFPFYYEAKILFVVWLISPYTKGASFIYRKFIHPLLVKHEQDIDQYLDKAKNDSYKTLMRFGSKTIVYAKEVVATAAIRGQEQLVNQLKKSYSLGDVSEIVEDEDLLDSGRRRRETVNNLQMSTNVVDADGSVHVWEGHYGVDGKKIEKQLVDFIDSDESSSNIIEELLGQQAKPVLKTKDDNAVGVGRSSASSTASVANKSSLQKRREIDIYATTSRRGPVTRSTGATSTILKK